MEENRFAVSGFLLFLGTTVVNFGNLIFWLVLTQFVTTSEVGQASIVISFVVVSTTIFQLGMEYPLLKSIKKNPKYFGTSMILELLIILISLPIILYIFLTTYEQSLQQFDLIIVGLLLLMGIAFVSRFSLLGMQKVKIVILIMILGNVTKFTVAIYFAFYGFGTSAILISFIAFFIIVDVLYLITVRKKIGFGLGNLTTVKEIIKSSLVNAPGKLSRITASRLTVILLPIYGILDSEIGTFYIALMISIVAASFASSLAFMVIPASSTKNKDLSTDSLRIGLGFTSPLIAVLIVAPGTILGLIGPAYTKADDILLVFSIGILPYIIISNTISKFNNLNKSKKLALIGSIQIISLIIGILVLIPTFGIIGAAYATVLAFFVSSIPSIVWSERMVIKHVLKSSISIIIGLGSGYLLTYYNFEVYFIIPVTFMASLILIFLLRIITVSEIKKIIQTNLRKN